MHSTIHNAAMMPEYLSFWPCITATLWQRTIRCTILQERGNVPSSSPVSLDLSLAISRSTFSLTAWSSSVLSDVLSIVRKDSLLNIVSLHCKSDPVYDFTVHTSARPDCIRYNVFYQSVCPSVDPCVSSLACYKTCKQDTVKTNELVLMQTVRSSLWGKGTK